MRSLHLLGVKTYYVGRCRGSQALLVTKIETHGQWKHLSSCYVLVPVECKIPRFVQFINKDSSAGETNKTPGELFLLAAFTLMSSWVNDSKQTSDNVWNLNHNLIIVNYFKISEFVQPFLFLTYNFFSYYSC